MMDNFVNVPFRINNLDRFHIRKSILQAIIDSSSLLTGELLDLGCGQMPYRDFIKNSCAITNYVGVDIYDALIYNEKIKPDYYWDGINLPFDDNTFNSILMTEVLEHLPNPLSTLNEAYRVTSHSGHIIFTVPYLWPLHEVPYDEFRYTPFSLERLLTEAGFTNIQILPTGGWHASMAQMLGLWVRRSDISKKKKLLLSILLKPIIRKLLKIDSKPDVFLESQMITGLYGTAQKL